METKRKKQLVLVGISKAGERDFKTKFMFDGQEKEAFLSDVIKASANQTALDMLDSSSCHRIQ